MAGIVNGDREGVLLSGMGQQADVIILGHGFVRDGDKVEVVRADETIHSSNSLSSKANE